MPAANNIPNHTGSLYAGRSSSAPRRMRPYGLSATHSRKIRNVVTPRT
jgi:hypothetical protein